MLCMLLTAALTDCMPVRDTTPSAGTVDDAATSARVRAALLAHDGDAMRNVVVRTDQGIVELSGSVPSEGERAQVAQLAANVPGVRGIRNELRADAQTRRLSRAIDDDFITTRVKIALLANPITRAHQIDVTTVNGVVSLSGAVATNQERATASELARAVQGVQSVDNLLQLSASPVTPAADARP
jgi:osmotically-inducible protein OsmY